MLDHAHGSLQADSALITDSSSKLQQLKVDNLDLNGNSITSTNTNGDIILDPNGTGKLVLHNVYINGTDDTLAEFIYDTVGGAVTGGTGITVTNDDAGNTSTISITNQITAGSAGSATQIPVITFNAQGQLTAVSTAAVATALTVDGDTGSGSVDLLTDDLRVVGTANEIVTVASKSGTDVTLQVGLPDDVTIGNDLTVLGDLQVTGTTTTNNVETVSTSNGVIFEGNVADANELTLIAGTLTADRTVTLPDATGTVALTSDITDRTYATSIGDGINTSIAVTHNLGTKDVIVQLYDVSSNDTVYADVVRTSTTVVTLGFGTAPATNDIRVLVSKIG